MSAIDEATRKHVKNIVCDILEVEPEEVTETSLLAEEHDADSLRSIEILAAIEVALQVSIAQAEMKRMVNLEGIYAVLADARTRVK
ncbi:acyl carrier protein [Streptomyces griseoviridis]|uniref:Acyl carrier protein n=1 Tax=Streptomyces griseoviridis TaxID=45398 RepID=A0A3Q9KPQ3_STRGD|nr:acyl carrier protein [Streptomyces griseoviridis]AZS83012.1 acyl carrier protein [Streptomyces griseoviridis]QCN90136.1 polyketide-8 synthase acyl carrier protein [Streptomyces griseoviridis]